MRRTTAARDYFSANSVILILFALSIALFPEPAFSIDPTPPPTNTPTPTLTPTITPTPRVYDFPVTSNELNYEKDLLIRGDRIQLSTAANRSYECRVFSPHRDNDIYFTGIKDSGGEQPLRWSYCGQIESKVSVPDAHPQPNQTRICFTTSTGGDYYLTVSTDTQSRDSYFRCQETTLFGGYNTSVADFNFLEVKNITDSTVDIYVTAINYDGSVVIDNVKYEVGADQRFDVNVHDVAGTGVYGVIRINAEAPIGSLIAELSEYVLTSVSPLDFQKVGSSKLETRKK